MAVDWCSSDKLWQPETEPRRYSTRDQKAAEKILRKWGFRVPLLVTRDCRVIGPFVAVIAARRLSIEQIPVLHVEDLSEAEQSALSAALSRFYELGQFDQKLLGELILDMEVQIPTLEFKDIGLEAAQVDRAVRAAEQDAAPDEIPALLWRRPVSKIGDLWRLGEHHVLCGMQLIPHALIVCFRARPQYGDGRAASSDCCSFRRLGRLGRFGVISHIR